MGYILHHCAFANAGDMAGELSEKLAKDHSLGTGSTCVTGGGEWRIRRAGPLLWFPLDGSKEGWPESDDAEGQRTDFMAFCSLNGSGSALVEVYGESGEESVFPSSKKGEIKVEPLAVMTVAWYESWKTKNELEKLEKETGWTLDFSGVMKNGYEGAVVAAPAGDMAAERLAVFAMEKLGDAVHGWVVATDEEGVFKKTHGKNESEGTLETLRAMVLAEDEKRELETAALPGAVAMKAPGRI